MKNNDELFINITPGEAPDLDIKLSSEEEAQLTANVLAKIQAKQNQQPQKENKVINFHKRLVSLVAAAVLLVASTTAIATIATGGLKNKPAKIQETHEVATTESVQHITETTAPPQMVEEFVQQQIQPVKKKDNQRKYVQINADELEGYTMTEIGDGWYSFENDDDNTRNFDCQVIYADRKWSRDLILEAGIANCESYVPTYQWIFLKDKKALHVKFEKDWVYTQQLVVRYKNSNYALNILTPCEINKSELLEIGKKVTLEICPESQASEYIKFSTYLENYCPDQMQGEIPKSDVVDYSKVTYVNQTINEPLLQYTVESVTEHKNINSFIQKDQECEATEPTNNKNTALNNGGKFFGQLAENVNLFSYSDGTLCPYVRSYVYVGDGINTPKQKIVFQNIMQKFYTVKVRIKNTGTEKMTDINLLYPLKYISDAEDYYYDTDVYTRPVGINSCQIYSYPKYFSPPGDTLSLEAGQEQVVELGYFVDEDLEDNMFMTVLNSYVDIRK